MATLLGDMRSGHSQWSRDASRNCLAADLYLGNSDEEKCDFARLKCRWVVDQILAIKILGKGSIKKG